MKKYSMMLLLVPFFIFSQEKSNLQFASFSFNPLSIYSANNSSGFSISGDVGVSHNNHDFLISAQFGREFDIWSFSFRDSFSEFGLLWGKKLELASWLRWDGFAGLSYFYFKEFNSNAKDYHRQTTVGVPFISKLKCMIGNYFSVGIQLRADVNFVQSMSSGGLVFQVDF